MKKSVCLLYLILFHAGLAATAAQAWQESCSIPEGYYVALNGDSPENEAIPLLLEKKDDSELTHALSNKLILRVEKNNISMFSWHAPNALRLRLYNTPLLGNLVNKPQTETFTFQNILAGCHNQYFLMFWQGNGAVSPAKDNGLVFGYYKSQADEIKILLQSSNNFSLFLIPSTDFGEYAYASLRYLKALDNDQPRPERSQSCTVPEGNYISNHHGYEFTLRVQESGIKLTREAISSFFGLYQKDTLEIENLIYDCREDHILFGYIEDLKRYAFVGQYSPDTEEIQPYTDPSIDYSSLDSLWISPFQRHYPQE